MRRVPLIPTYGILGSGRLARHLAYYLASSAPSTDRTTIHKWSRNGDAEFNSFSQETPWERLRSTVEGSDILLLAVADDALPEVIQQVRELAKETKPIVHLSGAQEHRHASSLHPLMTFAGHLYSLDDYKRIPFCEVEPGLFKKIFPHLENPTFHLSAEQKSLYHAYLVVAGNFSSLLWRDVEGKFVQKLKLDSRLLRPYKEKIFENILLRVSQAATGPLARQDEKTLTANKQALQGDTLLSIYEAFEKVFIPRKDLP